MIPIPVRVALASLVLAAAPLAAQDPGEWNSRRAAELIERARERRALPRSDSGLASYRAAANGYVYFYLDRRDSDERTLVRVDQLALEVFWAAPNHTKQRIVGMRDADRLPNRIYYHLDHLTVVQNEFDDRIRLGDGDEVRDVLHPAAAGADSVYDLRLADSLSIRLPGAPEPIRVYELEVRPRHFDRPALIGSVFLDRATADIVRMTFTFTPASYVDQRLDYIRVSLDNGLWEGRYWLPNEQRLEIRRQMPQLDFPAGSVIRGVIRVGDYRLNEPLPPTTFWGPRVVAVPEKERLDHPFEAGIFEGLDEEGLAELADLAALERQAFELAGERYLSGLPRLRLLPGDVSSVLRYNRAEEAYLGGGISFGVSAATRLEARAGYATGPDHFSMTAAVRHEPGERTRVRLHAERNGLRDAGLRPELPGLLNSVYAAMAGDDFLDPYYADAATLHLERSLAGPWRAAAEIAYETHRSARREEESAVFDADAPFRAVRPVDEGELVAARLALSRAEPAGTAAAWSGQVEVEGGTLDGRRYLRPGLELGASWASADRRTGLRLRGAGGLALGDVPPQRLFLLGGPATIPGFAPRSFAGDRYALAGVEASREVLGPWIRLRATGAAAWTDARAESIPSTWTDAGTTGRLRASVGAGVGLIYDVLRLDLVRGLGAGGEWQAVVSVSPSLGDIL